jgi:tRNA threonylcarbamoyladenosine biosynthesis protein TsaE
MEWGEQMAAALAPERLERPLNTVITDETSRADNELTSNGTRTVTFIPVGASWQTFDITRNNR